MPVASLSRCATGPFRPPRLERPSALWSTLSASPRHVWTKGLRVFPAETCGQKRLGLFQPWPSAVPPSSNQTICGEPLSHQ